MEMLLDPPGLVPLHNFLVELSDSVGLGNW